MITSAALRRIGWAAFAFMWVPFAVLMISMLSLPSGSYDWSEIPRIAQLSMITGGALAVMAIVCLVGAPILNGFQNRAITDEGITAEAVILGLEDSGTTINNNPVVRIRLEVQPADELPFEAEAEKLVSRLELAQIQPGAKLQVKYDPETLAVAILDDAD